MFLSPNEPSNPSPASHQGSAFRAKGGFSLPPPRGKAGGEGSRRFGGFRELHGHAATSAARNRGALQTKTGGKKGHVLPVRERAGSSGGGRASQPAQKKGWQPPATRLSSPRDPQARL
jgi:hypothetical protein